MQLLDTSAGNSCYGNTKKQCSLLCFVSFWLVTEWGENATQLWRVREVLHDLLLESLGKFLIGGEILGGLSTFCVKTAVMGLPFCVFRIQRKDEDIKNRLFTGTFHYIHIGTCTGTCVSALLHLHKWKSSCDGVWLSGWSVVIAKYQATISEIFVVQLKKGLKDVWTTFCTSTLDTHIFFRPKNNYLGNVGKKESISSVVFKLLYITATTELLNKSVLSSLTCSWVFVKIWVF